MTKGKEHMKLNRGAVASLWSIASTVLCRGLGFLFTPIFTRVLSPEEYGIYPLYVSLMGVFTVIITLEASGGAIYRALARLDTKERDGFLSSLLGAELILTLIFTLIYLLFRERINALTSLGTSLTLVLFLQIFLNMAEGIYFASKRYAGDYRTVAIINIARGATVPLLSLLMIRLGFSGEGRIFAPLITSFLISLPTVIGIIKRGRTLFSRSVWRYISRMLLPMLPHYLATSLIAGCDKIIIARLLSDADVGKYSAVYSIGFTLSLVTGGLMLVLTPWLMRKLKEGRGGQISEVCTAAVKLIVFATLIFLSVLPEVLRIVATREYYESGGVAYLASLSVVFSFLSSFFGSILLYYEKPLLITKNSLICAALTILLTIAAIRSSGYIGASLVSLFSYLLLFVENAVSVYRKTPQKKILNVKALLKHSAFMFTFAFIIFYLRFSFVARLLITAALVLMLLPSIKSYKKILT